MIRPNRTCRLGAGALVALLLAGCATVQPDAEFDQVRGDIEHRTDYHVHWYQDTDEDDQTQQAVHELLENELTAEEAVQIALLNNRRLQATYQDLGVAQADLVQAGLLSNPVFSGELLFPVDGGSAKLELGVAQSFLEIFYIPLRRQVAESQLHEAKLTVTGAVLDLAYQTRTAFYAAQAAAQRIEMFEQIVFATELGYDFAQRLYDAGNITSLELHEQRDLFEEARMSLRRAERLLQERRERVNRLMGVFGNDTQWQIADRLPDVPEDAPDLEDIETRAIEASLDLAIAGQRIQTAGRQLGITETTALVPHAELGVEAERQHGDWAVGPTLKLPIPLFDHGQARLARTRAELRQQQERYTALAVEIRSLARQTREQLEANEDIASHYQQVILPLRQRLTNEAQLQYNAMAVGLIELLRARERQIMAGERYIEALHDYWVARAKIDQLLRGRTPHHEDHDQFRADPRAWTTD